MRHLISSGRNVFIPIDGSFENPLFEHDTNSNAKKMWIKMLEKEGLCTDSKGVDIGTLFVVSNMHLKVNLGAEWMFSLSLNILLPTMVNLRSSMMILPEHFRLAELCI